MAVMNYTAVLPLAGVLSTTTGKAALKSDGTEALAMLVVNATASGVAADAYTPVTPAAATATNAILLGGAYNTTPPTFTNTQQGALQVDPNGNLRTRLIATTTAATDAVSNNIGFVTGLASASNAQPLAIAAYQFNGSTWDRVKKATTVSRLVSAAGTNNATLVKASAGDVFAITGYNAAAAVRYLKLYNKATAPTVGTDTPFMTIALKPSDVFNIAFSNGLYFATGIGFGLVTGSADADNTAVTAADIVGLNVVYQ